MSVPAYPACKGSGISHLGSVPQSWTVTRLRFVARFNPSKSETAGLQPDTEVSFLPMDAIGEDGSLRLDGTRELASVEQGYTYFRDGDVVIAKITPCFENGKGALMRGLLGGIGFGTTELIVLRPIERQTLAAFLHWLFASPDFRNAAVASMYGAGGQKRVPDDFVRDFVLALPPITEQSAIVAFLDRETGKIDALVAEQERLMALLKEKRQAVISQAVTKGLDPNAPMKPSGVAWLGQVPVGWEVTRLKFLAHVQGGIAKGRDLTGRDTISVPYLRVANVQDGYLDLDEITMIDIEPHELDRYALRPGDVLMNEGGDFDKLGRGHIWRGEIANCIHQNHVFAVRPHHIEPEWLTLVASADYGRFFFMSHAKQSTNLASISSSNLQELPVCCPPPAERRRILKHVERDTVRIGALTDEASRAITLLKERRAALISAAVTGKIDVRGFVSQEARAA